MIRELINPALALAALGSIESLLSAVVADGMTVSEKHNSDRELIGQGLANIIVPFFGGIPATGVIARTAVNVRSGGKTRLSGVIHGLALAIIVLTLAPLAACFETTTDAICSISPHIAGCPKPVVADFKTMTDTNLPSTEQNRYL